VRLDPAFLRQPAEHLGRAIGMVLGLRSKRVIDHSTMMRAAPTAARRITSKSTMTAWSRSIT
jgi:hypothetical protein